MQDDKRRLVVGEDWTPEYAAWAEALGDQSKEWEALMASVQSAEASHKAFLVSSVSCFPFRDSNPPFQIYTALEVPLPLN